MNGHLLDSHSLLWSIDENEKLSRTAFEVIANRENTIYVSSVTFWEISIKTALGKLSVENYTPLELLKIAQGPMGLTLLPLSPIEAATFCQLPLTPHKDPFDRMLIWQAISSPRRVRPTHLLSFQPVKWCVGRTLLRLPTRNRIISQLLGFGLNTS